ncbi:MAG: dihydrodipicolinate reductase [Planctomycetota bacterium]
MTPLRIAQFGLGPIGIESLRLAAERDNLEIVGGIDIDPAKVGRPLAQVAGIDTSPEVIVYESFAALLEAVGTVDVVLHTAGSNVNATLEQIEPMVRAGVSVATTCEPMLFPSLTAPEAAERMDELCRACGARVVGTGVNPGFVLDLLPVVLTAVTRRVGRVYGERVVNASTRRGPLQKKIGSGMDPAEFRSLFAAGKAGHAGFRESAALVAHCLGWPIDDIRETCEPLVAETAIQTEHFRVEAGQTRGLHQIVQVFAGDTKKIELDLKMYLDAPNPHDLVRIEGEPEIEFEAKAGVAGDTATVASLVNVVPRLLAATPGLKLMTDLGAGVPLNTTAATLAV